MNADALRRRAEELKAEVVAKTADLESDKITKADYREFVGKAAAETDEIAADLKTYGQAKRLSGGTEVAVPEQPGMPAPQQDDRFVHAKHIADTFARMKAAAENKTPGQTFNFDLGLKTQGEANLLGENAFGTTAGVPLTGGQYFLPGTAGPDILPSFIPGILELRWYDNVIASLFPTFPTDSPVVSYVRESNWTNNSAATSEGQTFPTSTNQIQRYTAQLGKVANISRVTDEVVADSKYFAALVQKRTAQGVARQEEVQLMAGSGYPGVEGLLQLSTSYTQPQTVAAVSNLVFPTSGTPGEGAASATITSVTPGRAIIGSGGQAVSGSQIAIGIFAMLTDIRVLHFFEPTAIVMNPIDWFTVRTWQDANGQFLAGSPWHADYGQAQNNVNIEVQAVDPQLNIWGKRVVTTPAIPAGYILVGDFTNGGQVIRKGGLRVEMVNVNGLDFEQGMWTMRAYSRLGLAVERPELFELAQLNPL